MNMKQLKQSQVRFDEDNHRYYIGTHELKGITGRIHQVLAPGMDYTFADTTVGTNAHKDIESINMAMMYGMTPIPSTEHGKRYLEWYNANASKRRIIESEYIVTDNETYASPIDQVFENAEDGSVEIFDTKTYKTMTPLNRTMAQWQLSIYAHFFELQNGYRPAKACILQVNEDKVEEIEVQLMDCESVKSFLYDEYFNPYEMACDNKTLAKVVSLTDILEEYETQIKLYQEQLETFKTKMLEEMKENKFTKAELGNYKFAIVAESKTERFDSKRFKDEHPEMYSQYTTETIRKEYLKVTKSKAKSA